MTMFGLRCLITALLVNYSGGNVLVLNSSNFDEVVDGSAFVLVKFYAPWCSPCQIMAPEYIILGDTFNFEDGVVIAEIDGTENTELSRKFQITGYPALIWFPRTVDGFILDSARDADSMTSRINAETGLSKSVVRPSDPVVNLDSTNFDATVNNPSYVTLVNFYAPWCGHSKAFSTTYSALARAFAAEDDVIVAKVDATENRALAERFDVSGFPTLKLFTRDHSVETYYDVRDLELLVALLNTHAETSRTPTGDLQPQAGLVTLLAPLVRQIDPEKVALAEHYLSQLYGQEFEDAQLYVSAMRKVIQQGYGYVEAELLRLESIIQSNAVSPAKKSHLMKRRNILRTFKEEEDVKEIYEVEPN